MQDHTSFATAVVPRRWMCEWQILTLPEFSLPPGGLFLSVYVLIHCLHQTQCMCSGECYPLLDHIEKLNRLLKHTHITPTSSPQIKFNIHSACQELGEKRRCALWANAGYPSPPVAIQISWWKSGRGTCISAVELMT